MNNLDRLIEILCAERGETVPALSDLQKPDYFRALCNVRPPKPVSAEFLALQDEYLSDAIKKRGIVETEKLRFDNGIALYRGDITALDADAIVNAANSAMLGCFTPLHKCIDNAIHSAAGVQVRLDCNDIMQGGCAKTGEAIVTKAYNLPSKFIFHVAGPIVCGTVTQKNRDDLKKCYVSCLNQAESRALNSIAFCCVSTGIYGYPKEQAAALAVETVRAELSRAKNALKAIFCVYTDKDYEIYSELLGKNE